METTGANVLELLVSYATTYGIRVIGAILVLIGGRVVASIVRSSVMRVLRKSKVDETLVKFAGSFSFALIIVFTIIAALKNFGVEVASFVAVLGAAGFAVGFALQGSLSNFASGIMLLVFRPFKAGDFIEAAGVAGSVKELRLFTTTLATPDNIQIIVPNSKVFGDTIKNITAYDTRRVEWVVGISYGSSMDRAMELVKKIFEEEDRILDDPAPMVAVTELADSSVNLVARAWVKRTDFWNVKFDLTKRIKDTFDANDIEIPFPQRVVHMVNTSS